MERIATDILGELQVTERGNKYILVVAHCFSKWTECIPMGNMEARTVVHSIVEQVITRIGVPYIIHSNQGTLYESQLFAEMCKLFGIKKTRTTPYHPKSDGMAERFNKTLASMLRAYVDDHHRDWDTHLPYLMMAYRSDEHDPTGCTPNALMLG
jgi:transposase InsO family protein